MSKFLLIDHSLRAVGGHNYEYALHVCGAAERAGHDVGLAVHRRFQKHGAKHFPRSWKFFAPYRFATKYIALGTDQIPDTPGPEAPPSDRRGLSGWLTRLDWRRRAYRNRLRMRAFEQATRRLWQAFPLGAGDHAFLATASELDLLALTRFLESEPKSKTVDWRLQFHFLLPKSDAGEALAWAALSRVLERCHARLSGHRVHFYATTELLAAKYNQLSRIRFQPLPYPVNEKFQQPTVAHLSAEPLRLTCIGGVRAEKGLEHLPAVLREIGPELLATGKAKVVLQAASLADVPKPLMEWGVSHWTAAKPSAPIWLARHPLGAEDYRRLVLDSSIGLFLYDRAQYADRCSGILVEMLTAGIPVIVPAGCWLAEQIAEANYRHCRKLGEMVPRVASGVAIRWSETSAVAKASPAAAFSFGGIDDALRGTVKLQGGASRLLLSFHNRDNVPSEYIRIDILPSDAQGQALPSLQRIFGQQAGAGPLAAVVPLPDATSSVELRWSNAYAARRLSISDVRIDLLASPKNGPAPLGAVGLIAANPEQVADLIREMAQHYDHYHATAQEFARSWIEKHNPRRLIQELTRTTPSIPAARVA